MCHGHENVTARHKTTLEFTKDKRLTLKGDCIMGIKANFSLKKIKRLIESKNNKRITITIKPIINKIKNGYYNKKFIERINAEINPSFNSDKEIVIRKTDFISERTFAINADRAACDLSRDLIKIIANKKQKFLVIFD